MLSVSAPIVRLRAKSDASIMTPAGLTVANYTQNPWTSPVQDGGAKLNHDARPKGMPFTRGKTEEAERSESRGSRLVRRYPFTQLTQSCSRLVGHTHGRARNQLRPRTNPSAAHGCSEK